LASSATQVLNGINLQQAALISILGYDSNVFGPNNVSISAVVRDTSSGSQANEGAGALVAAYRFTPAIRAGLFIDYAPWQSQPSGLQASATQPTWGGFAVYEQQADGTGVQARAAIASGRNTVTITRSALLEGTEAGRGKASLNGWGAAAELGYGFRLAQQYVAMPFLGLRYTDVTRGSYSEWQSTFVASPLTYNALAQQLTTGTAGLRLNASITPTINAFIMAGVEYDFGQTLDPLSGTSPIEGLESFSVATSNYTNRVRATGAAGLSIQPQPNQKLSAEVALFQQAYTSNVAVTGLLKYTVGF
jgi:outer membrane autotransporter protein